jgi:hypothetical protein
MMHRIPETKLILVKKAARPGSDRRVRFFFDARKSGGLSRQGLVQCKLHHHLAAERVLTSLGWDDPDTTSLAN